MNKYLFLLPPDLPSKIKNYKRHSNNFKFVKVFDCDIENHLTKSPPKPDKNSAPEGSTEKCNDPKRYEWHTKYTCWNRDKVSNDGNQSTEKSIEILVFEK